MADRGWLCRVASHPRWGGGHVSRCRALGKVLRRGAPVTMMLDVGGEAWARRLAGDGFQVMTSGDPLESGWRGAVADGYGFRDDELARLKQAAGWLAAFEDGLHPHRLVDLAINGAPGLGGDRLDGAPALLGPRYAILADGFAGAGPGTPREPMRKVLVSFGVMDDADLCGRTLDALAGFDARTLEVTIAIGAGAPHLAALRRRAAASPHRVEIRLDAGDMAELLGEADIAIGAGGVSLYERLAAGVPSLTILVAENQRLIVEGAVAAGATLFLGAVGEAGPERIAEAVGRLDRDRRERARLARAGRALIDGHGAERTAAALEAFAMGLPG